MCHLDVLVDVGVLALVWCAAGVKGVAHNARLEDILLDGHDGLLLPRGDEGERRVDPDVVERHLALTGDGGVEGGLDRAVRAVGDDDGVGRHQDGVVQVHVGSPHIELVVRTSLQDNRDGSGVLTVEVLDVSTAGDGRGVVLEPDRSRSFGTGTANRGDVDVDVSGVLARDTPAHGSRGGVGLSRRGRGSDASRENDGGSDDSEEPAELLEHGCSLHGLVQRGR